MSDLRDEMEDDLRKLGLSMLKNGDVGFGVFLKGDLKAGVMLTVEVVRIQNGKVLNANV